MAAAPGAAAADCCGANEPAESALLAAPPCDPAWVATIATSAAVANYQREVRARAFPTAAHVYSVKKTV